jgi:hypothetical protein
VQQAITFDMRRRRFSSWHPVLKRAANLSIVWQQAPKFCVATPKSLAEPKKTKKHAISIVIYCFWDGAHDIRSRDLRGQTWERDFKKELRKGITVYHVAESAFSVNGVVDWTVLPEGPRPHRPFKGRENMKKCWRHFIANHPNARWFLRGDHDMYVNITNLRALIAKLDSEYDPMTEWVARHGCTGYEIDTVHSSTGILLSQAAVKRLVNSVWYFDAAPSNFGLDFCMRLVMDRIGVKFYEGCSPQFFIGFPRSSRDLQDPIACPQYNIFGKETRVRVSPLLVSRAVAIHMHDIRMELWTDSIRNAENVSVYWDNDPFFCLAPRT